MRTTIDLPDSVFRETKALAAMRGITMKEFIIQALEQAKHTAPVKQSPEKRRKFPSFHLRSGRRLDLSNFDFDDLLT